MTSSSNGTTSVRRLLCLYIGNSLLLHLSRQSTLLTTKTYCVKGYGPKRSLNFTRNLILNTEMSSTTSTFSEIDKFDGTNWLSWRRLIRTAAVAKGAFGYLDGSITCPSTPPATTPSPAETSWDSNTPSLNE